MKTQLQFGTNMPTEMLNEVLAILERDETILSENPTLRKGLENFIKEKVEPIIYLTRGQVAKLLQISLPTLHDYTKRGALISYRIGSKVRYKASEIDAALKQRNFSFQRTAGNHGA